MRVPFRTVLPFAQESAVHGQLQRATAQDLQCPRVTFTMKLYAAILAVFGIAQRRSAKETSFSQTKANGDSTTVGDIAHQIKVEVLLIDRLSQVRFLSRTDPWFILQKKYGHPRRAASALTH